MKVSVIGAGSWGTAIAALLARKGHEVYVWARDSSLAKQINENNKNPRYLTDLVLPKNITVSNEFAETVDDSGLIVLAVPSHAMRSIVGDLNEYLNKEMPVISLAKGIEVETLLRMSEVIAEQISERFHNNIAVLSGPNHAEEVAAEVPSASVIAAQDSDVASYLQSIFMSSYFRIYTNSDIVGVELGGAVKNIIAIAAGISDGLGFGDNTKAALITRGLAEMTRLGVALGAQPRTFSGLSGLGDLVVTCTSKHSRNRALGEALGKGQSLDDYRKNNPMIAEGANCCLALKTLCEEKDIEMPINKAIADVLYEKRPPAECVEELMTRGPRTEG